MSSNSVILQIRKNLPNYEKLNFLDYPIEINGNLTSVSRHISVYIQSLKPKEKIRIIMDGLKQNIEIDPLTLQFESINAVCEDVIVGFLTKQ